LEWRRDKRQYWKVKRLKVYYMYDCEDCIMIPTKSYQKREGGGNIMEGVNV
jgi:hypothetical protein